MIVPPVKTLRHAAIQGGIAAITAERWYRRQGNSAAPCKTFGGLTALGEQHR
jgi:hypothetical protein